MGVLIRTMIIESLKKLARNALGDCKDGLSAAVEQRICLVGSISNDTEAIAAANYFGVPVVTSETGNEFVDDQAFSTYFVLENFEGPLFDAVYKSKKDHVLGVTALKQLATENEPLPNNSRPLYNVSMRGVIVCVTGFRVKEDLTTMIPLIHHMGGSIRKEIQSKVTHLIANCCGGDKYQYAYTFRVPIMSPQWVHDAWQRRHEVAFRVAQEPFFTEHKLQAFCGLRIGFVGFSDSETEHMKDVLESNGGVFTNTDDPLCSHVVLSEETPQVDKLLNMFNNNEHKSLISTNSGSQITLLTSNSSSTSTLVDNNNGRNIIESANDSGTTDSTIDFDFDDPIVNNKIDTFNDKTDEIEQFDVSYDETTKTHENDGENVSSNKVKQRKKIKNKKKKNKNNKDNNKNRKEGGEKMFSKNDNDVTMPEDTPRGKNLRRSLSISSSKILFNKIKGPIANFFSLSGDTDSDKETGKLETNDKNENNDSEKCQKNYETKSTKRLSIFYRKDNANQKNTTKEQTPGVTSCANISENMFKNDSMLNIAKTPDQEEAIEVTRLTYITPPSNFGDEENKENFDQIVCEENDCEMDGYTMDSNSNVQMVNQNHLTEISKSVDNLVHKRTKPVIREFFSLDALEPMSIDDCAADFSSSKTLCDFEIKRKHPKNVTNKSKSIQKRKNKRLSGGRKYKSCLDLSPSHIKEMKKSNTFYNLNDTIKSPKKMLNVNKSITYDDIKTYNEVKSCHYQKSFDLKSYNDIKPQENVSNGLKSTLLESGYDSSYDVNTCDSIDTQSLISFDPVSFRRSSQNFKRSSEVLDDLDECFTPLAESNGSTPYCASSVSHLSLHETNTHSLTNAVCTKQKRRRLHRQNPVVDESEVNEKPEVASARTHIVKSEWFWTSVQLATCVIEKEYLFDQYLESKYTPRRDSRVSTPNNVGTVSVPGAPSVSSVSGRCKRRRLHDTITSLKRGVSLTSPGTPVNVDASPSAINLHHKRPSSVSDAGLLSVSGSFLDCTQSPDKSLLDEPEYVDIRDNVTKLSPRQQVFMELYQTETNYVGILNTIMTMFKEELEKKSEDERLLNNTELKIIFGHLPPIYETHQKMLEELRYAASHWMDDTSVGDILLRYAPDLIKAYPPFINYFETTKEMLEQCDSTNQRFHAFLKRMQTRPECGRQSLQELLIRPVQRLPSISLLLSDILKHTSKSHRDNNALERALAAIKEVMTHINEDKRKTEGQLVMFDIFNDIDNCPPHLVSSHRSFVKKCEVQELSESLSGRGDILVFHLFSDILEVCKKRKAHAAKSPNAMPPKITSRINQTKPYKHVRLLPLSTIKKVIDIRETEDCQKVFALVCRNNQEFKEKCYSFTMLDELDKQEFLKSLCRQIANTVCKADSDIFLSCLESQQLNIDTSDLAQGTLSKAFKFASRTRMKVGRAFSFNKTPGKLKRAVSTMMSPFGSTTSLTPASHQLANMKLASCSSINDLPSNNGNATIATDTAMQADDSIFSAPLSVQPIRKTKCSSLSLATLRRL